MPRNRKRWRVDPGVRAQKQVKVIASSIAALDDEDLLDLADIFEGSSTTPLGAMARMEMKRRNIRL
jgi:hypothetical protein